MANINEIQTQLDTLKETKAQIKQSIIDKGKEVSDRDSFRSYANKIDEIVTLEEGTSDANATSNDIAKGKTAYVNGVKITGNIYEFSDGLEFNGNTTINDEGVTGRLRLITSCAEMNDSLCRFSSGNFKAYTFVDYNTLANAIGLTGDKIKKGETILGITGTYEPNYAELGTISPTEYDTAVTTSEDILGTTTE